MAVTTKYTFPNAVGENGQSATIFANHGIENFNQDNLDVYVTLSGGTRVLQNRQTTSSTTDSNHKQVGDTTGLYFPSVATGVTLYNYTLSADFNTITFSSALPADAVVSVERRTRDADGTYTNFTSGSSIRSKEINNAFDESNHTAQEARNKAFDLENRLLYSNFTPYKDNTIDLGSSTKEWKNLYIDGVAYVDELDLDDDQKIKLGNSDDFTIYFTNSSSGQAYIETGSRPINLKSGMGITFAEGSETLAIFQDTFGCQFYQNVVPNTDNTRDLGSSSKEWKDLYVDGTGYIDTISADTATINGNLVVTGTISDSGGNLELSDDVNISGHLRFPDDKKIYLGNGDDAYIDWDTDGWFDRLEITSTGAIKTTAGDGDWHGWYIGSTFVSQWFNDKIQNRVRLEPQSNNSLDLGTSTLQWKDLYVDGTGYIDTVNADDITGSAIVTSGTSTSDTKVYSAKRCDELYYNIGTTEEIVSGEAWQSDDAKVATTAAIDARIIDLVDDVGGFVPIANETSFPNANPDVNNGAGTIVSIGSLASNLTSNGSGVISISNGTVGNSTVTINGAANNTTYSAGYGMLVETTSTLNTYTFHRLSSKATEVTTVAGNITNINTVAGNNSNINTVAGISGNVTTVAGIGSNVTTVAGISSDVTAVAGDAADIGACSTNIGNIAAIGSDLANNYANITDYGSITGAVTSTSGTSDITTVADNLTNINAVAGKNTEIGRLGTADAVADIALLGTAACVADMAILGTTDVVSDLNTLATADVVSDLNTLASAATVSDMDTLADIAANITTVSDNKDSVTTCAGNIANINNASTHAANALAYRNAASAILTQADSAPYNLADNVSSHTAWGDITDTGANAVFTNETSNILLTMSEGSSTYNYGSIT